MKAATIFLLAVTVFTGLLQQSSAAPNFGLAFGDLTKTIDGGVSKVIGGASDVVVGVTDTVGGVVGKVLGVLDVLAKGILGKVTKDIETVNVILGELIQNLINLPKEAKEKVKAVITKVANKLEQIKAVVDKLLKNGSGVTVETVKEAKVHLAQIDKEIEILLKELPSNIEAILEKGKTDVSAAMSIVKSVVTKVTQEVQSIVSKLSKVLEALLKNKNGAEDNSSDKFRSMVATRIQNSNERLAEMLNALEGWNTATDDEKVAMEKCKKFMDSFTALCDNIHDKLASAALSGDETSLKGMIAPMKKAIADTKAALPELLVKVKSTVKGSFEGNVNKIIENAEDVMIGIENYSSSQ